MPLNAITDVAGVEVGFVTLISGSGKLEVGTGPVRTGVTAILPRGKGKNDPVMAGTMRGVNDRVVEALPHDRLKAVVKKYGRL